ncbi:MAG: FAD-dependent oxidoreductase [Burkholderiaceae bacterium]
MTTPRPADAQRRALLAGAAALPWAGCSRGDESAYDGVWLGAAHERGHRVRDLHDRAAPGALAAHAARAPAVQRRAGVIVVGAGIAGLTAARALRRAGVDDVHVFELEDSAGGNSRGHTMGGMACPLGAHYLPVPGAQASEVAEWVAELGLSRVASGITTLNERHLCHSPQERLFIGGAWVEGLLPPLDALPATQRSATQREYQSFHDAVEAASRDQAFCIPTARASSAAATHAAALGAVSFASWLDAQGYRTPALRWYLDYCCRDDFGAGAAFVSAWAGLHYFASRHGFHAPGADAADTAERGAVFTWPEGNAWLVQRLAVPLGERLHPGRVALRVRETRHDASVDLWNAATQSVETWSARYLVLAVPLFIAARLVDSAPGELTQAAALLHYAPWLVANLRLREPLVDRGGAAPAWDNVIMDSPSLGYVDAMHQSTRPHPGPTVLTAYWALGGDSPQELRAARALLLEAPWSDWAGRIVRELARAHPEVAPRVQRIDLMRYGHAMAIPAPGVRHHGALQALSQSRARVRLAHSDLAGYSVFEEAFFHGDRVGRAVARELRGGSRSPSAARNATPR